MSTVKTRMEIELADWPVVFDLLHETYKIWGAGLDKDRYYQYIWWQLNHPWSKRHYRYYAARKNKEVVTSCKLYTLHVQARGKTYKVGGIGGVFTKEQFRGHGFAGEMISQLTELCRKEDYDAMLLHSDIEPDFYYRLGFEELGDQDFNLFLDDPATRRNIMAIPGLAADFKDNDQEVTIAQLSDVPAMVSHHRRWLSSARFGIQRSEDYWSFKLAREKYMQQWSAQNWPATEMIMTNADSNQGGYALFEQGTDTLRVLEVIGPEAVRERLWRQILRSAVLLKVRLIRGWEGTAPEFLRGVAWADRGWSHPMLQPLNPDCSPWLDVFPCPLLELDHF